MPDRLSTVQDLYPPGNRLALRAQAAEQLIQATDPAQAGRALFDLIAAELKLNVFLLHACSDRGQFSLVAHGGLSDAEAATAAAAQERLALVDGGQPDPVHVTSAQGREDDGAAALGSIGLRTYFGLPLMAGRRLLGFLGFGRRWADSFEEEDLAFLRNVGNYLALALERVRWETALRESEERLRLAMDLGGIGVTDCDFEQESLTWSAEVKAIHGFDPDETVNFDKVLAPVHPDDVAGLAASIEEARSSTEFKRFYDEYRITRRDGALRWVAVSSHRVPAPRGGDRPRRTIGVAQDITERKLADQRLRESEQRLRLAMETAGFGVYEYDIGRNEFILSPELRAIQGFTADETVDAARIRKLLHPDDGHLILIPLARFHAGAEMDYFSEEFRIIRPDGEIRWLSLKARLLMPPPGSSQGRRAIGVVWDITRRKLAELGLRESEQRLRRSEQRLQLAQEMGGVASFEWDPVTDETWVSESYRQLYGLAPADPINIGIWRTILHPEDRDRTIAASYRAWETGVIEKYEYRIIRPLDQQERWIYSVTGASATPPGSGARLVGICLDVTERKRNEERERLLSREVDHRAKNLLSVVQAMVQLTHADTIPEFIDQIKGRIHALGRAHSLLAASRWSGAELSRLIEDELAPFVDDAGRVRLSGPAIALRPAAAQSMALVIHELTTNAAKYGALSLPEGRIEVSWDGGGAGDGRLALRWRERGGPAVVPPRHFGFGLTHIRGSVERQLGGALDLQWHREGLECGLSLPARQIVEGSD